MSQSLFSAIIQKPMKKPLFFVARTRVMLTSRLAY